MLLNCTRQALKLVHLYAIQRSIFASLTAGSVFTSFRPSDSKRADVNLHNRIQLAWAAKKMDASSIITQVSRDQDQYNGYHPSPPDDSKGSVNADGLGSQEDGKEDEGLLNLLCCFKKHHNKRSSTVTAFENEAPPSPKLPERRYLLSEPKGELANRKCVVIDLDETLVHSSFKPVNNADFIVPVEIDGIIHQVYVLKRPHVDEFLRRMGQMFECILFTASLSKYADPVSDLLDTYGTFHARLFRESCVFHRGNYVKDLSKLGRDIRKVVIIDNSPASYIFHPDNAIPVSSWFDDPNDTELRDLIPFFEALDKVDNVLSVLGQSPMPTTGMDDDEDLSQ